MKKNSKNEYSIGFKQFIIKTSVFILLFIILSFIIGQKIVESKLLYGFDIFIYGGMGYLLLFSIVGFIILYRSLLFKLQAFKSRINDFIILIISIILLVSFYILELNANSLNITILNIFLIHLLFLSMFFTLILGIYGIEFSLFFIKKFKKELFYLLVFCILAYSLMNLVWKLWPYLSYIVTKVVFFLMSLFSKNVKLIGTDTLFLEDFGAKIGEACSGIFSIFIFTGLYLFILFVDWNKFNKTKVILMFIPAVIGAFLLNIIRVFLLMEVGAYFSRTVALGMYHSYTGMLFFMVYFVIFWLFAYKWMKK